MAIVQISKIQQRSGNLVDLPQLDEAELGWASDVKRLFIGKTSPNENIEVLTSYSDINFSQITGAVGNLNITAVTAEDGQVLTYDGTDWVNRGGVSGGLINLGDVANVKISGGAISYVLETDGTGNLSWTPKTTIVAYISNITQANPAVVTTTANNYFTNGVSVTITDVLGMTQVNGNTYYVDVLTSNTFALYSDSGLTTPVNSTGYGAYTSNGRALSSTSGGGSSAAGGSNSTIQFNNSNLLDGDSDFTWNSLTNILNVNGNANVGNLNSSGIVTSTRLVSNIATGTAPLTVSSTTRVSNLNVAYANVSDFGVVTAQSTGTYYPTFVSGSSTGNYALAANSGISANLANGSITATTFVGNVTGNISGNLVAPGSNTQVLFNDSGNANATSGLTFNKVSGALSASLFTGTLTTASQPNVTSLGTLTSLSVTGNVTAGNLVGIFANGTSNVTIPAVNGNVNISSAGNANVVVVTGTGANVAGTLGITGNVSPLGIKTDNYYYANGVSISFAGSYSNSNVSSFLASFGSNTISTTGNITGGNMIASNYHIRSVGTSISAAGSTQGTGTALTKEINQITTVSSGQGVVLPTAVAGMAITIINANANSLLVYPATGAAINALATNAGFTQANANATIQYVAVSTTQWYTVGATYA